MRLDSLLQFQISDSTSLAGASTIHAMDTAIYNHLPTPTSKTSLNFPEFVSDKNFPGMYVYYIQIKLSTIHFLVSKVKIVTKAY